MRPALVMNSPKRSTSRAKAKARNSWRKSDMALIFGFSIEYNSPVPRATDGILAASCTLAAFVACASSPSTSTASAPPSARASRAGSRASSRGTSCACRSSRRITTTCRAPARAAQVHVALPSGASARATRAWASTRARRRRSRRDSAAASSIARAATCEAHFRDLTVISLYLPSGSSGPHRQASKFRFLDAFLPHLAKLRASGREIILCGDWNIAHQNIDLTNWRSNRKNSRLPARGARVAHPRVRRAGLRRRVPQASIRGPSSTRGGPTAGRRGRRTSAGASTTRSRRRASPPRRTRCRSTRTAASPITRRS